MFDFDFPRATVFATALALVAFSAQAAPPLPKGFDTECAGTILRNCHVTAAGVTSLYGEDHIAFQIQEGYTEETGILAGVVLFEAKDDEWVSLETDFSGVVYRVPQLVDGDRMILHVPGFMGGTGGYNSDVLLVRDYDGGDWQRIDIDSWREDVVDMLPEGLEIWKGVDFDFGDWYWSDYSASTPLWQQSDANCCPTGGWAEIEFEITDGRLVPVKVHYRPEANR